MLGAVNIPLQLKTDTELFEIMKERSECFLNIVQQMIIDFK